MFTFKRRSSSSEEWQPSPYCLRDHTWWRICVGSQATATYSYLDGYSLRQCRVYLHIPVLVEARSIAFAQSLLPEILASLSSAQLILGAQVFSSGFHPPAYQSLVSLSLDDPCNIILIDYAPEEES